MHLSTNLQHSINQYHSISVATPITDHPLNSRYYPIYDNMDKHMYIYIIMIVAKSDVYVYIYTYVYTHTYIISSLIGCATHLMFIVFVRVVFISSGGKQKCELAMLKETANNLTL